MFGFNILSVSGIHFLYEYADQYTQQYGERSITPSAYTQFARHGEILLVVG